LYLCIIVIVLLKIRVKKTIFKSMNGATTSDTEPLIFRSAPAAWFLIIYPKRVSNPSARLEERKRKRATFRRERERETRETKRKRREREVEEERVREERGSAELVIIFAIENNFYLYNKL
jgi:hypothetical protein